MKRIYLIISLFLCSAVWLISASYAPLQYDRSTGKLPENSPFTSMVLNPAIRVAPVAMDVDAQSYCDTVGMTDPDEILRVNQFVLGLKGLNLWTNCVQLFDLRSHHNVGSSTTLVAMKGGNGTIAGAPGWTTNGLVFTNNGSQYVTFSNPLPNPATSFSVCAAYKANPTSIRCIVGSWNASPNIGPALFAHGGTSDGANPYAQIWCYSTNGTSIQTSPSTGRSIFDTAVGIGRYFGFFGYSPSELASSIGNTPRTTSATVHGGVWNGGASWVIGKTFDNFFNMDGDVGFVGIWNVYMTSRQVQAVRRLYEYTLGVGYSMPIQIIWEGDSLIGGYLSALWTTQEQMQTNTVWGPIASKLNISASGDVTSNMVATAATEWCPHRIDGKLGKRQYLVIHAGINDLTTLSLPATTIITNLLRLYDSAKAYGMKVVAVTPTPSTGLTGQKLTEYNSLCALIRTNSSHWDYLLDLAAVPALTNASNATYFPDGVHLSDLGYQEVLKEFLLKVPTPVIQ